MVPEIIKKFGLFMWSLLEKNAISQIIKQFYLKSVSVKWNKLSKVLCLTPQYWKSISVIIGFNK